MKKFVSMKEGNMSKCLNDETKFEKFIVVVMGCENPLTEKKIFGKKILKPSFKIQPHNNFQMYSSTPNKQFQTNPANIFFLLKREIHLRIRIKYLLVCKQI